MNDDVPLAPAGLGTSVLAEHPAPPDADSPVTQVDVAAAERDRLRWPCSRPEAQDQAGRRAARTRRGRGRHIGTRAGASAEDALRGRASSRPFLRLPLTHGSARRLRSPRAETTALSRLSAVIARCFASFRWRARPRPRPQDGRALGLDLEEHASERAVLDEVPKRRRSGLKRECLRDFGLTWPDLRNSARTIMVALVRVEELRPLTLVTARSFPLRCHHGVRHHFRGSSLILSPPLATGTTQSDVASTDELRRVI